MWCGSDASITLEDDEAPFSFISSDSGRGVNALEGG